MTEDTKTDAINKDKTKLQMEETVIQGSEEKMQQYSEGENIAHLAV